MLDQSLIKDKNILIIGPPASGKTYMSNVLKSFYHRTFHTDDYMKYGYKESLYVLMRDLEKVVGNTIIEGIQGYRLLRKGVELNCYYPDVVIEMKVTEAQMIKVYRTERVGKKVDSLYAFNNMHQKILNDYRRMHNPKKPEWVIYDNNY